MQLSTYVRNSDYDRFARLALKHGISVSATVREVLLRRLHEFERGEEG